MLAYLNYYKKDIRKDTVPNKAKKYTRIIDIDVKQYKSTKHK